MSKQLEFTNSQQAGNAFNRLSNRDQVELIKEMSKMLIAFARLGTLETPNFSIKKEFTVQSKAAVALVRFSKKGSNIEMHIHNILKPHKCKQTPQPKLVSVRP